MDDGTTVDVTITDMTNPCVLFNAAQFGIGVTGNTPPEIIDKLNKEINAALADPKMKSRFADIGGEPLPGSPAGFGKLIAEETEKWGRVVRAAGMKPE